MFGKIWLALAKFSRIVANLSRWWPWPWPWWPLRDRDILLCGGGCQVGIGRSPTSGIRCTLACNVKSVKHTYMSINIKKAMNLFLFLTVRNACICALKVFTNSHISLWFSCSTASTSFVVLRSFSIWDTRGIRLEDVDDELCLGGIASLEFSTPSNRANLSKKSSQ
jgi:hypothetical protein